MKKGRIVLIIIIIALVLFVSILLVSFIKQNNIENLRKYSVNIAKCYTFCPIEGEESVAKPGEMFYYVNLSCRTKCHETHGFLTLGDISNMNLSDQESDIFTRMYKELDSCITSKISEEEIASCLDNFVQKYS